MRNLCIVLFAIILSGCTDNLFKQSSIGKEYEVLLVSDDSLAKETIRNILETEVEGVPQFEPSFDVAIIRVHVLNTKRMCMLLHSSSCR